MNVNPLHVRTFRNATALYSAIAEQDRQRGVHGGRVKTLADLLFSYVDAGKPNRIKSARPGVFHIMLQKEMRVRDAGL